MRRTQRVLLAGVFLMGVARSTHVAGADGPGTAQSTGASVAFTSNDPFILHLRTLIDESRFAEVARAIHTESRENDPAAAEALEICSRISAAYNLDAATLLDRLKRSIPDVTLADLERWRLTGQVQFRTIDGQVRYFGREPANIFRFCGEAKTRRQIPPSAPATWTLESHLKRVIAAASEIGATPNVVPIRHRVRYLLSIPPTAPGFKANAIIRAWLPFPQVHARQRNVKLLSATPAPSLIAPTSAPQRTLYFQQAISDPAKPVDFEAVYEFTSYAYYPSLVDASARPLPPDWSDGNLAERPPHIRFSPALRQTAASIVGDDPNPLTRARKIFRYVTHTLAYCAEEEYGTIPSLSEKALTSHRGDCGVHAMLFITLCRCAGIPARWQSGWETKRIGADMHDWAEFYVEPWGWLPADPTYGAELKDNPDEKIRDFYFGHQDAYRLIVNSDYGTPVAPPKPSLRSEPLDFQRGEVEIDAKNLYFPHWSYDFNVEWLDGGP